MTAGQRRARRQHVAAGLAVPHPPADFPDPGEALQLADMRLEAQMDVEVTSVSKKPEKQSDAVDGHRGSAYWRQSWSYQC